MLLIEDLQVELSGKLLLRHVDLEIKPGETHVLFGPNGSGKTSLLMTILGMPGYIVKHGRIVFKGEDITHMPIHERAQLGIGMAFQRPPPSTASRPARWWASAPTAARWTWRVWPRR